MNTFSVFYPNQCVKSDNLMQSISHQTSLCQNRGILPTRKETKNRVESLFMQSESQENHFSFSAKSKGAAFHILLFNKTEHTNTHLHQKQRRNWRRAGTLAVGQPAQPSVSCVCRWALAGSSRLYAALSEGLQAAENCSPDLVPVRMSTRWSDMGNRRLSSDSWGREYCPESDSRRHIKPLSLSAHIYGADHNALREWRAPRRRLAE